MIGFPKPRPRIFDKIQQEREAERIKREVYAEVDARDGKQCRCCGRRGNPYATTALERIHRAHIVDASRGGEITADNLVSLCALCHALEHAKQLYFVGSHAGPRLRFEIDEAAVVEVFGNRPLPRHVSIIVRSRR